MNRTIGEVISTMLFLAATAAIGLLYNESTEQKRLVISIGLTIIGILCLEILFLQL